MTTQTVAGDKIPSQMNPRNRHCRPRDVPLEPVDLCRQGPITEERLRNLLAAVYDRFLVDIHQHRAVGDHEDDDLVQALGNCYVRGRSGREGRRTAGRLTRIEQRLIRLAYACRLRFAAMDSDGPISLNDLELLDALGDIVNGAATFDWRIDRECRIHFD
jgi:hypothetical protein